MLLAGSGYAWQGRVNGLQRTIIADPIAALAPARQLLATDRNAIDQWKPYEQGLSR